MKIALIQVGKTTDKHLLQFIEQYSNRVQHYVGFDTITIPELRNTKALSPDQQKQQEGDLILRQLQPGDYLVLLDEHGREPRSVELAQWLQHKQNTVSRRLVFVIGGPYGFSPQVYQRANEQLSLSRLTFSHQMVRLLFVEQIYRALTILKGEPYHHE